MNSPQQPIHAHNNPPSINFQTKSTVPHLQHYSTPFKPEPYQVSSRESAPHVSFNHPKDNPEIVTHNYKNPSIGFDHKTANNH